MKCGAIICSIPCLLNEVVNVFWSILGEEFEYNLAFAGLQKGLEGVVTDLTLVTGEC